MSLCVQHRGGRGSERYQRRPRTFPVAAGTVLIPESRAGRSWANETRGLSWKLPGSQVKGQRRCVGRGSRSPGLLLPSADLRPRCPRSSLPAAYTWHRSQEQVTRRFVFTSRGALTPSPLGYTHARHTCAHVKDYDHAGSDLVIGLSAIRVMLKVTPLSLGFCPRYISKAAAHTKISRTPGELLGIME